MGVFASIIATVDYHLFVVSVALEFNEQIGIVLAKSGVAPRFGLHHFFDPMFECRL